jgi:putative ABC transport system permease protein
MLRGVGKIVRPILGVESQLGSRQLLRHRTRTSLTVGVLVIAVVFAVGFGQTFRNSLRHLDDWFTRIVHTDFYVRGAWPDATLSITTPAVAEAHIAEIAALEGVTDVNYISFVPARAGGRRVVALAYSFRPDQPVPLPLVEGTPESIRAGLLRGEVVLGTALAHRLGLHVGDRISIETRAGPAMFRVSGTTSEYTGGGMALYMQWSTAQAAFGLTGVHAILATADPASREQVGERLRDYCRERGLLFQSNADVHRHFDGQLAGLRGFVWMLIALVFVVASLGIVNTLTMNVLEQTRELGVLRAIGMKRLQVGKLMVSEAVILGLIGLAAGIPAGLALAYLINLAAMPLVGHPIVFHVDAVHVGGCAAVALAIVVLAAWGPARRAARLRVVQALQYE